MKDCEKKMHYLVTVKKKGTRLNTFSKEEQECDYTIYEQRFHSVDVGSLVIFLNESVRHMSVDEAIESLLGAGKPLEGQHERDRES